MKPGEHKLGDTRGRFLQVIKNGREIHDVDWTSGRILLSNRRLILAGTAGKRTIELSAIEKLGGRFDVNQRIATVSDYFSIHIPSGVVLLAPVDYDEFEIDFFGALLNSKQFLARHPAVAGGVVQNTEWEKARLKVEEEAVSMATVGGKFVEIRLDDIGAIKTGERKVVDDVRSLIEVEHSDDEGTSLQTYISGPDRAITFLYSLLREGEELSETSIELSETDKQVLTALYSGVAPFDIPDFLGLDVDQVEELFERLIDHNVVEEVRIRHEVQLNARGRNIASEAINEQ
ncbi:chemotaxis protein CheF1 [Haloferax sp. MBLA0076]|uniref:Taxis protein CheF n=1 Tax=Haloferax litoreum TaxID=2666140 RepID=A0A6A8GLT6_9EURY|nr:MULTISPECIES: CheF family chemotaxis protein [Haloferax]KAB1194553.1 chemotaxis protein CheF1 [Haloferax sp. CBA1148]MRX23127.1 chemotaxis protein CheF1 [Haloferax litoreum]